MPTSSRQREYGLRRLAAAQAGHFSAAQALDLGYSYPAQTYHTKTGNWRRVARGVFRLPEWPVGEYDDLVRWTLWTRGVAVVSHDTAVSVHDLADVNPARIHLTVPPGSRTHADGVVVHYFDLVATDVLEREGYRITTPFRTVVDAGDGELSLEHLTDTVKNFHEREPQTNVQRLRDAAERRGHRAALRIERALHGADIL